jgi:hypothetical protein
MSSNKTSLSKAATVPRSSAPTSRPLQTQSAPAASLLQLQNGRPTSGAVLQLQQSIGNRAVNRLISHPRPTRQHTIPRDVERKMEHSLGADFSNVTIHEGAEAPAIGALAYTQGESIHFAPGQYAPHSQSGQQLLGHELTHVLQQRSGEVTPTVQTKGLAINTDQALEHEADVLGAQAAATHTSAIPCSHPFTHGVHTSPVIQGMFAAKLFGTYHKLGVLKDLLEDIDPTKAKETEELFNEPVYYDWDTWKEDGAKTIVEAGKVTVPEAESPLTETKEERKTPAPPTDLPPTHLPDETPEYVPSEHRPLIRTLGGPKRTRAQVVLHSLGEASRVKSASPLERVRKLEEAVLGFSKEHETGPSDKESESSPLTIFVAPEGYFSFLDMDARKESHGRHQYTKEQFLQIVAELRGFSRSFPNILIIPGSILWFEAPAEEPIRESDKRQPEPKHIEYTYNTSPVVYNGKVFLYNKHVDTGGDIDPARHNQRMKMQEIGRAPFDRFSSVGYFDVGGLRIGLEICGDHGEGVLHKALAEYRHAPLHVDFHVLIAAGQDPASDYPYRGDGWVINADAQPGSTNFGVYKITGGRINKTMNIIDPKDRSVPPPTDKLAVVEGLLGSIGSDVGGK